MRMAPLDVVLLVQGGVLVHLDENDVGVLPVFDDPDRVDQKTCFYSSIILRITAS